MATATLYYTDPACPWSWAFEPSFRRLVWELGGELDIAYVMCGMRRELDDGPQLARQALEASAQSGMPVDPRLWLEGPPASSHPACIAVKAAAEQGLAGPYLRRVREGLFCRRRRLDTADALMEEARAVPGLDPDRFQIDLGSHATLEAFGADLERAQAVAPEHWAEGSDRVKLPSLEFRDPDGSSHGVYGFSDYETVRAAALRAGAGPAASPAGSQASPPTIHQALRRFGAMATVEVAAVCQVPGPPAPAELWRLASQWEVRAEPVACGELWSLA
ncbi:MAG: DsbA family protein [Solirubrobacterales bacterium]|nr:DsbA family protein [Solirubrobacterales bacterium]